MTCYECSHHCVCKYFNNALQFEYRNDSFIKDYLHDISKVLATACKHYHSSYALPDSIQEALNSGDGVYRP